MAQAIRLARRGRYSCHPNPRVGCVLVRDGTVIAKGWHRKTGEDHAEVSALKSVDCRAKGATAYVTLEPCSHEGKTPPCADALIAAGVVKVIAAVEDPNPKVAGKGLDALRNAGIEVHVGLMQNQAETLNKGFISRIERQRPYVTLKVAASLDGSTAMTSGESQWITGEAARTDVQKLRAESGAILTGINTVIEDDPSLTVRASHIENDGLQPLRVILDSRLRTPTGATILSQPGDTLIFCAEESRREVLEDAGAIVDVAPAPDGRVDIAKVLGLLAQREINDVLVEAGPGVSGGFLTADLVDELVIYQAPHIMGSETRGMFNTPLWTDLQQRLPLEIIDVRQLGNDMRITARPGR